MQLSLCIWILSRMIFDISYLHNSKIWLLKFIILTIYDFNFATTKTCISEEYHLHLVTRSWRCTDSARREFSNDSNNKRVQVCRPYTRLSRWVGQETRALLCHSGRVDHVSEKLDVFREYSHHSWYTEVESCSVCWDWDVFSNSCVSGDALLASEPKIQMHRLKISLNLS